MNVNFECVPDCGTDNCNCKDCMFYGGMSHGAVRCLAEEKISKTVDKPRVYRSKKARCYTTHSMSSLDKQEKT